MHSRRHSLSRYIPPSSDPFTHFKITRGKTRHGFKDLPCLLARAWADGNFELLTPAWDMLGYSAEELAGRCVCELIALEPDAARSAVKSLLTEGGALEFSLVCKDGHEMRYHWNRQFDDFTSSMFIIGERLPARSRTRAALPGAAAQRGHGLSFNTR
jgi:hypothetical protein